MKHFRPVPLTLILLAGLKSQAQQLADSAKPVFKVLDSVEISAFLNTSLIKPISSTATKTPTPVINIPQTISSITRQLMDDKMDFTLKDAVTDASNVNSYSGYDEYTIRGFLAENPRSINGLRGYNSTYSSLLLFNIESVDVLKGPAAVLYGNTDAGGTINLTTKKPLSEAFGQVNVFGGSWDHFRASGDFSGPVNNSKTILYRMNAGFDQQNNGFSDQFHSKAYQIAPSFAFIPNKSLQINVDFSLSKVNTVLNRGQPGLETGNDLYATPAKLTTIQPGDYLKQKDISSMISLAWKISDSWSFHTAYLNYQSQQNVAEHGLDSYIDEQTVNLNYHTWSFNTNTNSITNYFNYKFHTGQLQHNAMFGYDYISTTGRLNLTSYENADIFGQGSGIVGTFNLLNPQYNQMPVNSYTQSDGGDVDLDVNNYYTQGLYIQDQITYKKLNVLLGVRREYYRTRTEVDDSTRTVENVWLPRVGLVYGITPNLHIYGVYSRGFDPYEISNTLAVYNEPFKPINSELFELGFKAMLLKGKLYGALSVYQLSVFNVAVNANDPTNPDLYVQRGEDQARGVEAELNGNILPNLQVHFAYAYNRAVIKKSDVKEDIGMLKENAPVNSSNGFFKYGFVKGPLTGFSLTAGYTLIGKRNTLDRELQLPGYFTMQGGVNYEWHPITISFLVNNIGNVTYWNGAYSNTYKWPGEGRNFMVKMSWDLPFSKPSKQL
jgi:iron complex outermembrane receptor protein